MIEFIRRLIDRRRLERFRRLIASFRLPEPPPADPYAPVRYPRSRMPGGRSAAAAVDEPRDLVRTEVRGRKSTNQ
jgi:hypothetical protein